VPSSCSAFSFSGWHRLQGELERVPELACTAGTGVLGMCDMAARAWANVEEGDGKQMSSLAARSIRASEFGPPWPPGTERGMTGRAGEENERNRAGRARQVRGRAR
jgi:hypothetical protein